jgi:hypothetical protein
MPSVLAFEVTLGSLTLANTSQSVPVLPEPTPVEFSRLLGLRTLLGLNSVPAGTYTSATVVLASPVISYLDLSTTPASVGTINGTLTNSTLTVPLTPPLVVGDGGLAGLHFHFVLRESLQVDANGDLTGVVDPHLAIRALPPGAEDTFVDELRGGVSSVNAGASLFVLQTPRGRLLTIRVNGETVWEEGESLATLTPPAVVEVSGRVNADGSLTASTVDVLTRDHFLLGGLVLDPDPPTGPAERVTLLVREEIPDLSTLQVGRPATLEISEDTRFDIQHLDLPLEFLLFNRAALARAQRVAVGGMIDNSTSPSTLHARRVALRRQGLEGLRVPGSVVVESGNTGRFRLHVLGLGGYLLDEPLRVATSERTRFIGVGGLAELEGEEPLGVRVVGLLLRRVDTGEPVFAASVVQVLAPSNP